MHRTAAIDADHRAGRHAGAASSTAEIDPATCCCVYRQGRDVREVRRSTASISARASHVSFGTSSIRTAASARSRRAFPRTDPMHDLRVLREQLDAAARRRCAGAVRSTRSRRSSIAARGARARTPRADPGGRGAKAARNADAQEVARRRSAKERRRRPDRAGPRARRGDRARSSTSSRDVEGELAAILLEIPNITLADVPAGGEENNVIVRELGRRRARRDGVQPHWEIGAQLGLFDLERGGEDQRLGLRRSIAATARGSSARC